MSFKFFSLLTLAYLFFYSESPYAFPHLVSGNSGNRDEISEKLIFPAVTELHVQVQARTDYETTETDAFYLEMRKNQLEKAVSSWHQASFFGLTNNDIYHVQNQNPWIESLEVQRQVDFSLRIKAFSKMPRFALLTRDPRKTLIVDTKGEILPDLPEDFSKHQPLTRLNGPEFEEKLELRKAAVDLWQALPSTEGAFFSRVNLSEISYSPSDGLIARLRGRTFFIKLGINAEQFPLKVSRVNRVGEYLELKTSLLAAPGSPSTNPSNGKTIRFIDTSFEKRVLVKFNKR